MKKILPALFLLCSPVLAMEVRPYQVTAALMPQTGLSGRVAAVQACSTNTTGTVTVTVSSITDLLVNGSVSSFTNELATVQLVNGVGSLAPTNVYVAPRQRVIVSGSGIPGGSAILWLEK